MNILDVLKAKFAGNQAVLDEIATEEAQAAQAAQVEQVEQPDTVDAVEQVVEVEDTARPAARFATLRAAYDKEKAAQA